MSKNQEFIIKILKLKMSKSNQYLDIDDIEDNLEKLMRYIFTLEDRGKIFTAVPKTTPSKWFSFLDKFLSNEPEKRRTVILQIVDLFYRMNQIKNSDERGEYMQTMWNLIEPELHNL